MLDKNRFAEQIELLSSYFMVNVAKEVKRTYWIHFKEKSQEAWDKAIMSVMEEEKRFPMIAIMQIHYEAHLPPEESEFPTREDLRKAAKTKKAKHLLGLVEALLDGKIDIEDPGVQLCLEEQGDHKTFSHYDPKRRIFAKTCRPQLSLEHWDMIRERLRLSTLTEFMETGSQKPGRHVPLPGETFEELLESFKQRNPKFKEEDEDGPDTR